MIPSYTDTPKLINLRNSAARILRLEDTSSKMVNPSEVPITDTVAIQTQLDSTITIVLKSIHATFSFAKTFPTENSIAHSTGNDSNGSLPVATFVDNIKAPQHAAYSELDKEVSLGLDIHHKQIPPSNYLILVDVSIVECSQVQSTVQTSPTLAIAVQVIAPVLTKSFMDTPIKRHTISMLHANNIRLKAENEKPHVENIKNREALSMAFCPSCGDAQTIGDICPDEHQIWVENA
ncbi:hypothetical protein ACH5RR_029080 [Cinchona calisaya]|uniref:Uncharacterized protein n=1 Tax=Cinchona calisaya TaxID=153742 RepID=A0ABD2YU39_9GENT